jgi:hypothetical protein
LYSGTEWRHWRRSLSSDGCQGSERARTVEYHRFHPSHQLCTSYRCVLCLILLIISGGLGSSVASWSNQVIGTVFWGHNIFNFYAVCQIKVFFCVIPFYLQSVPVHSATCVQTYTMAWRRVLSSAPLWLIGSRPLVAFVNETYELNLKN